MHGWEEDLIAEDEFLEEWGVYVQEDGNIFSFDDVRGRPLNQVWSVTDSGGDRPDHWIASPGFHVVNVLGYVMTRKSWDENTPDAFYSFDDFDWEDAESGAEQT